MEDDLETRLELARAEGYNDGAQAAMEQMKAAGALKRIEELEAALVAVHAEMLKLQAKLAEAQAVGRELLVEKDEALAKIEVAEKSYEDLLEALGGETCSHGYDRNTRHLCTDKPSE